MNFLHTLIRLLLLLLLPFTDRLTVTSIYNNNGTRVA